MKVVIDIHESIYEVIKETPQTMNRHLGRTMMLEHLMEVINQGTSLPEGCGRLIDGAALEDRLDWLEKVTNEASMVDKAKHDMLMECIRIVRTTPTIL